MNRTCPDCGGYNPPEASVCLCGRKLQKARPTRFPIYLAILPLILPVFFMVKTMAQLRESSAASPVAIQPPVKSRPGSCVDVSGVTATESNPGAEVTTLLRWNLRNNCGGALKDVHVRLNVKDEKGDPQEAVLTVPSLEPGRPLPFEHTWKNRLTEWNVTTGDSVPPAPARQTAESRPVDSQPPGPQPSELRTGNADQASKR